jgi:hypothetical protein
MSLDSDKVVKLAARGLMLEQLRSVSNTEWLNLYFYPRIVKKLANQQKTFGTFDKAFIDTIMGFLSWGASSSIIDNLFELTPKWIDAIVPDKEFAKEAKELFKAYRDFMES